MIKKISIYNFVLLLCLSVISQTLLAEDKGTLKIKTNKTDADIYINGQLQGKVPKEKKKYFSIDLVAGDYNIEIIKITGGPDEYYGKKDLKIKKGSRKTTFIKLKSRPSDAFKKELLSQYKDGLIPIEMVEIPTGTFNMGCINNLFCQYDEFPVHSVNIKSFMLAKHEVTFEQWDACVVLGGCKHRPDDNDWGRGKRPVINVSWDDAQQYIQWINQKTDETYRLPTEAEWEYATRAGSTTVFNTGQCLNAEQENYNGLKPSVSGCEKGLYRKMTTEVGTFKPNKFDLHDMHGNVREWTQDCTSDDYKQTPADGSAWLSGSCYRRIMRGGSWNSPAATSRSAARDSNPNSFRSKVQGFRLAK